MSVSPGDALYSSLTSTTRHEEESKIEDEQEERASPTVVAASATPVSATSGGGEEGSSSSERGHSLLSKTDSMRSHGSDEGVMPESFFDGEAREQGESLKSEELHKVLRASSRFGNESHDDEFQMDLLPEAPSFMKQCMTIPLMQWLMYVFAESIWIYLTLLGIICALGSSIVDSITYSLMQLHYSFAAAAPGGAAMYLFWVMYPMILVGCSVAVTRQISPNAVGSGIPEMKSIMTGFSIPGFLTMRTLFAKLIGLCLALGSGLSIGTEGPFVHMSCIIASVLLRVPLFREIRKSRSLRKHVLAAACAVGVASSFGAPVGGVLFSVEVTNTIYQTTHHAKGFFCAVCGAFAFVALNEITQMFSVDIATTGKRAFVSLFTTHFDPLPYSHFEIPLFLLVSLVCGFAGGMFNWAYMKLVTFRRKNRKSFPNFLNPVPFALWVVIITATASTPTGNVAQYDPIRRYYPGGNFFEFGLDRVMNELFLETDMKYLNTAQSWMQPSLVLNLLLFALGKSMLTILAISIAIPSGIFLPIFAIGAAYGRLWGEIFRAIFGESIVAGGYAVVGAAAFTASCTGTVSTAVIIFEITSQMSYLVPVLLAVTVGRAAGKVISRDIYTCMGMNRHLPSLPELNFQKSQGTLAKEIMQPNPIVIPRFVTRAQLEALLNTKPTLPRPPLPAPPGGVASGVVIPIESRPETTTSSLDAPPVRISSITGSPGLMEEQQRTGIVQPVETDEPRAQGGEEEDDDEDDSPFYEDFKDPYYTLPVVDKAGLFLGSVMRFELEEVLERMKERELASSGSSSSDRELQEERKEIADITRTCESDGLAMNMPANTALGDVIVLFEVHKNNCFFITSHRKVIGRLDLRYLIYLCDEYLV